VQGDLPFREFAPVTDVLGVEMCRQARGKEQGGLATCGAERINGFIYDSFSPFGPIY
jgi:hypothetical protein